MRLSPADAEYLAAQILDEARAPQTECTPPAILARRLLGHGVQIAPRRALRSLGAMVRVGDDWRIYVQRGAPRGLVGHIIGHELAHWIAHRDRIDLDEDDCDWVGAALVLPRRVVHSQASHVLETLSCMAESARTTQSLVALRVGEVLETPVALVAPERVRVRGPESFVWPVEHTIRSWCRRPVEAVKLVPISDDKHRVVLVASDELISIV